MQNLRELIMLCQRHHLHPVGATTVQDEARSKLVAFYNGIAKGKFKTDADAAQSLYAEGAEGSKYRKLKSDLREKLLDAIYNLKTHQDHYTDYQRAYYECHRQWLIVRMLTGQNANNSALHLAARVLRQSQKYDFTLLSMDISSFLRIQYGLRESNDRKFVEANDAFKMYRQLYDAESLAEELYTTLIARYVNNRSAREEIFKMAQDAYLRIEPDIQSLQSYKLQLYGYMIGLIRYTSINDHTSALSYCDEALRFFENRPYEARAPLQIFHYQRLVSNIHLRQFEAGRASAELCLRFMDEGTFNWFKYQELYLYLSIHTRQYDEGLQILLKILVHPRFEFLPENAREIWRIYEAYVYLLVLTGQTTVTPKQKFKLARFINETPIYAKDKSGLNIAIIIVRFLFQLQERQHIHLLDTQEATEQYCYRYLRREDTQRSYYFLKLLLQIPAGRFDRSIVESKAGRYVQKLHELPLQVANQTQELEIIPYEHLWDIALGLL
jgi:hypothetical protein